MTVNKHVVTSMKRSFLRRPFNIESEKNWITEKTMKIDNKEYEADWLFKGYFPEGCREEPPCRIDRLTFKRDEA